MKCKETGEAKNIVFGLTGTGYFDMVAYQKYNDGLMSDYIPTDEEIEKNKEYANELLEISNSIIVYDLENEEKDEKKK